ncbi:MAG: patatin-like phospholipase family protein [Gaiellaceae bacterium]
MVDRVAARGAGTREPDGHQLALAIEGGAMRGVVSMGMLVLLEQLGVTESFDAIYGASAGALNGAFFTAHQSDMAATVYCNEMLNREFIDFRRILVGKPFVSLDYLLDEVIETMKPLDWEGVVRAGTALHPIATSLTTFLPVVLPRARSKEELKESLRASARIPGVAGLPVALADDLYFDATLLDSLGFRSALTSGATHVLVLRTRAREAERSAPSRPERLLLERRLRQFDERLVQLYLNRHIAYREELAELADLTAATGPPYVLDVSPAAKDPSVSQYTRSRDAVSAGASSGMRAMSEAIFGVEPRTLDVITAFYRG